MVMAYERERDLPRISVNKLGEYMVAAAGRRRRIIEEQRRPKDFIVARYTAAQDAIARFLVGGGSDERIIRNAMQRLLSATTRSEWEEAKNELCVAALDAFLDIAEEVELGDMTPELGPLNPSQLEIARVSISVRPEVILHGRDRNGEKVVGAVKLYLSKSVPLDEQAGAYVATLLQQYLTEFHVEEGRADCPRCLVVDVFAGKVYVAPRSYRRRRSDIEAACEEIHRAW